ncbi:hypothetical protein [Nonomuraea sp. NPDC050643]|uniref:hypothetical protein n=1 Tax=Nonomuraea sp. NPDC050643 TaxID=3155660 RepID=UPI003401A136
MNRTSKISLSVLAGALALAGGILVPSAMAGEAPPAAAPRAGTGTGTPIVLGHGLEIVESATAAHWVSGAQHVVVYTVSEETERPPTQIEVERQEGLTYRTVHARIDRVLWSKDGARTPPAGTWNFTTYGSAFNNNDGAGTAKFGLEGRPRVEAGHTYIAAIRWHDDPCSADDGKGRWGSLGSGAILPFDAQVIGQGEYEGQVRTAEQNKALMAEESADGALAEKLAGQNIDALLNELRQAEPIQGSGPGVTETCDTEDNAH